jgi:hypothetical protein
LVLGLLITPHYTKEEPFFILSMDYATAVQKTDPSGSLVTEILPFWMVIPSIPGRYPPLSPL